MKRYEPRQTYAWNYEHAPNWPEAERAESAETAVPASSPSERAGLLAAGLESSGPAGSGDIRSEHDEAVPGRWTYCGLPVTAPLAVAAGPLLNGRWCLYYAQLGFDVLTYKTVRSSARPCYELPNLQPVRCGMLQGSEPEVPVGSEFEGSWAVSFGMPSMDPEVWRRDIEQTRRILPAGKWLSVSVVGTMQPTWGLAELAEDYARCAGWAVESGADLVEMNLSCPNVATCDGQLYQQPDASAVVAGAVRQRVPGTPLIAKIGHVVDHALAARLLGALEGSVDALAMTNSVAARVRDAAGQWMFGGQRRGICGAATRQAAWDQVRLFAARLAAGGGSIRLLGVGGVATAEHVRWFLEAGAESVQLATAAMIDPCVARTIRAQWRRSFRLDPSG